MAKWMRPMGYWRVGLMLAAVLVLGLTSCAVPQLKAEDRLFLPVAIDLLDVYNLPPQEFEDTTVGGLSALNYDPCSTPSPPIAVALAPPVSTP